MANAAAKTYNINVTLNMKRSKEEVEVAKGELERLHTYIQSGTQLDWAKERIKVVTDLLLLPNPDLVKSSLKAKLEDENDDPADTSDIRE